MKAKTKTASRMQDDMPAAAMPNSHARIEPAREDLRIGFFLAVVVRLVCVTWMRRRECVRTEREKRPSCAAVSAGCDDSNREDAQAEACRGS